jgi:hypothetical protein
MSPASARWRAGLLLYAAVQFVALVIVAMMVFADGHYALAGNFLSELGATRTWAGAPNLPAAVLFSIALGGIGLAFVVFAGAWRAFAFGRGRGRAVGVAAQGFGTLSGAAFVAVACTPVNIALSLHNTFVLCAFGFLLGYAAALTALEWQNGAPRGRLVASLGYLVTVAAYFAVVMAAVRTGITSARGHAVLVISQKLVVAASMAFIAYMTIAVRRQLRRERIAA